MTISRVVERLGRLIHWPFRHWRGFVIFFIAVVIVHMVADQLLLRKLAQQREAIAAAGGRSSLAEFALDLDDANNAAPVYQYAATKVWRPENPLFDGEGLLVRYVHVQHPAGGPQEPHEDKKDDAPLSAEEEALVNEFIQRNAPLYAVIEEAFAKPACQFGNYAAAAVSMEPAELMPELAFMRVLARCSSARAVWEARQGNMDQACQWLAITLHLANDIENDPLLIAGLVRAAIIGMSNEAIWSVVCTAPLPRTLPPALLEELAKASRRDLWARNYEAECCFSSAVSKEWYATMGGRLIRPLIATPNQIRITDMMQSVIACVREEQYPARQARHRQIEQAYDSGEPPSRKPWRILCDMLAPAITRSMSTVERATAQAEGARLLLLLGQYHTEHGAYPNSLDNLVPGEIAALPEDPFSGKPFCYRAEGQGFSLYSVGEDGRDDAGKPSVKRGPGDIVWCVTPEGEAPVFH